MVCIKGDMILSIYLVLLHLNLSSSWRAQSSGARISSDSYNGISPTLAFLTWIAYADLV